MSYYRCSEIPSRLNDYLLRAKRQKKAETVLALKVDQFLGTRTRQLGQAALAALVGTIVYPLFAILDTTLNTIFSLKNHLFALITTNALLRSTYRKEATKCLRAAGWCLLGTTCAWTHLLSPDFVTRHFVPVRKEEGLVYAGGKFHFAQGIEIQPDDEGELLDLVHTAKDEKKSIAIAGARFSQSGDTLPVDNNSLVISMKKFNKVTVDLANKRAVVQAGATWADVQNEANKHGLAVKVMQASRVFSLGGSIGVNCHGWDHRTGTLGETIRWMRVINAEGQVVTVKPDDELFRLVLGGHGSFGIVLEAEIDLTLNEELTSWGEEVAPKDYVDYFQKKILDNANHVMHLYRLSLDPKNLLKTGMAQTYSRPDTAIQIGKISNLTDEPEYGHVWDRIMLHLGRSFDLPRALYWKNESKAIAQKVVSTRNAFMCPPILSAFNDSRADAEWLQEYFVTGEHLAPFLDWLGELLMKNKVCLMNASVRYVKADHLSALPYAPNQDHYAIVLFFNQSLAEEDVEKTRQWIREVSEKLATIKGTFYLPYARLSKRKQFKACYPCANDFIAKKKVYDQAGLYFNALYKKYFQDKNESTSTPS
jgi:hypothetical protein